MTARRKLSKHAPPRSDSESDEDTLIPLSVYLEAEIGIALQNREHFCRAVAELQEILALYSRASKPAQKQSIADTVSAIWLCDWSTFQAKALTTLVSSIEQHLPKAKREACLRECKQAKLSHHRKMKGSDAMLMESLIDILPTHLIALIFAKLTPPDLCRAACVSKQWNEVMVSDDSFWRQHYAGRPCNGCAREAFKGNDRLIKMWQTRRMVIDGKLAWATHEGLKSSSCDAYHPISVQMVTASLLGRRNFLKALTKSSDSDTDSEADDHPGGMWRYAPIPARQLQ